MVAIYYVLPLDRVSTWVAVVMLAIGLLLFAATYLVLSTASTGNFNEHLMHSRALYFTITVFSTEGFGDIKARSDAARLVITGQMTADLVILGVALKVVVGAVKRGHQRRSESDPGQTQTSDIITCPDGDCQSGPLAIDCPATYPDEPCTIAGRDLPIPQLTARDDESYGHPDAISAASEELREMQPAYAFPPGQSGRGWSLGSAGLIRPQWRHCRCAPPTAESPVIGPQLCQAIRQRMACSSFMVPSLVARLISLPPRGRLTRRLSASWFPRSSAVG